MPGLQRHLALLLLSAAALCLAGPAAGTRRLMQAAEGPEAAPGPAPDAQAVASAESPSEPPPFEPPFESIYGSPAVDQCVKLTNTAGRACTVESDTLSLVYPRGSEEPPTQEQIDTAILNMMAAAQPAPSCCDGLKPFSDARCPCDPEYQQLLPIGGFDPAYFEGATHILAVACGFDFPPCQPGETIQLDSNGN